MLAAAVACALAVAAAAQPRSGEPTIGPGGPSFAETEKARARGNGTKPITADPALEIIERNRERSAQITETSVAAGRAQAELAELRQELEKLDQQLRATKRRAAFAAERGNLGTLLLDAIKSLPTPERFAARAKQREGEYARAADARLEVDLARARYLEAEEAVASAMAGLDAGAPDSVRAEAERRVRSAITEQQALLDRLDQQLSDLLQTLQATNETEATLLRRASETRVEFRRLLFWVPLAPVTAQTFKDLGESVQWLVSAQNWRGVTDSWRRAAVRSPQYTALLMLVLIALLAGRRWLKRKLPTLAPGAIPLREFRVRHTLFALLVSLLLALPAPFALWAAGSLLARTADAPLFAQSAAVAFQISAQGLLFFRAVRWLFDAGGVTVRHFNWQREPVLAARRALQRLMSLYVPLLFVAVLGTVQAPEAVRQSIGRLAFILAMAAIAYFWRRAFRPDRPLTPEARGGDTLGNRILRVIMTRGVMLIASALIVLSIAGFYFAAIFIFELLLETILLSFAAAMVYGMTSLWIAVQRLRLAEVEAQSRAAAGLQPEYLDEAPSIKLETIDAETIDSQTRQLLNMVMTLVIAAGIWLIWSRGFIAFDLGVNQTIWTYTETVDGKTVTRQVLLTGVLMAFAVGVIAYIATRSIGGLLDIVLLQRLRLQTDANYAIKTAARYLTAGLGIVFAANLIGIDWSSVQWLVAALGVGLGFGLQEIVANFVSGLIVLGERPIRIGDWVTVGETSGTVTRIRARATVITDWDNKEVLIPNKAFITERVINWTLSSQTTRLLLRVGVAYGTDPVHAEKVLSETVRAHPEVLQTPAPSIYFMAFGESSLDFEIRAYVDATSKRLRTTHELNTAIFAALAAAGIEIPFPQRDIHIRSADGLGDLGRSTSS